MNNKCMVGNVLLIGGGLLALLVWLSFVIASAIFNDRAMREEGTANNEVSGSLDVEVEEPYPVGIRVKSTIDGQEGVVSLHSMHWIHVKYPMTTGGYYEDRVDARWAPLFLEEIQ